MRLVSSTIRCGVHIIPGLLMMMSNAKGGMLHSSHGHLAVTSVRHGPLYPMPVGDEHEVEDSSSGSSSKPMDAMCVRNGYRPNPNEDASRRHNRWYPDEHTNNNERGCLSRQSNTRGSYTSNLVACRFTFHIISSSAVENEKLHPHEMSALCSTDNMHMHPKIVLEEYVSDWPDECVADFQRCYSVQNDEAIFYKTFCRKEWKIPDGATHIGVDCTEDKLAKKEKLEAMLEQNKRNDGSKYLEEQKRERRETFAVLLVIVLLCFAACSSSMCCAYKWIFQPFITIAKQKIDVSETKSLVKDGAECQSQDGQASNLRRRTDKVQPV